MRRLALLALALLLPALPAAAQEGPSFDCAKAATKVEKQICEDWTLSAFDRWVAQLYKELRGALDAKGQEALKAEQRAWLKEERNACEKAKATAELDAAGALWSCLYRAYEGRAVVLAQSQELLLDGVDPGLGWSGTYAYDDGFSAGSLLLLRLAEGFVFQISSVSGPGAHICDLSGSNPEQGPDLLIWQEDGGSCAITFARGDSGVAISSNGCRDWCGANGTFDADYLPR